MSIQNTKEVIIGGGAALDAGTTALNAVAAQVAVVNTKMACLTAAETISTAGCEAIYLVNKKADGTYKRTFPIKGGSLTSYQAAAYAPATREVWAIGYNRKTAAGSIEANNSTVYTASIRFKNDKSFYSVRPEVLRVEFTSAAAATQKTIAIQIANAINNSAYGASVSGVKEVVAVVVSNGTGVTAATSTTPVIYGETASTGVYGVEITGLTINQFNNTNYANEVVYYSAHVDDNSGFGATTCTQIQAGNNGTGTYAQAYNAENFALGVEGALNRTLWPTPTYALLASSTPTLSGKVAAIATVTTVSGEDVLTTAVNSVLRAGELITVNGVAYEVKYVISTTKAVLTSAATASYGAGDEIKVKFFYNVINLTAQDVTIQDGSGAGSVSTKSVVIFTPAITAGETVPYTIINGSVESQELAAILDPWTASTPLAPAASGL